MPKTKAISLRLDLYYKRIHKLVSFATVIWKSTTTSITNHKDKVQIGYEIGYVKSGKVVQGLLGILQDSDRKALEPSAGRCDIHTIPFFPCFVYIVAWSTRPDKCGYHHFCIIFPWLIVKGCKDSPAAEGTICGNSKENKSRPKSTGPVNGFTSHCKRLSQMT